MKKTRAKGVEKERRDRVFLYVWEQFKSEMTMAELAKIVGVTLITFWRSVSIKGREK